MTIPVSLEAGKLPQAQADRYWSEGFLFPVPVITPQEAAQYRGHLEQMEREWREADLPLPLGNYLRVNAQCVMPFAHDLATRPEVLDVVEGIIGPDILIYSSEFFIKNAHTDHFVTMHQDLTYWGMGTTSEMVTAWIALSPATVESGCMDFVAGSHKSEILPHADTFDDSNLLSRGQEIQVEVATEDRTPITLQPGQMSLHHGLTIHGSGPNRSDDRRIGMVVRYISPRVAQSEADTDYAMIARGADRIGNFTHYAPPDRLFDPRGVALYEEIRSARAKAMMKGAAKMQGIYA